MHAFHYQHHVDVHLLFCFDLDLPITCCRGRVLLGFSSSILTDGYNFACSAQQKPCLFNKLSIHVHALQCQHDIDVHLLFCFDLDLHLTSSQGRVLLGFFLLILTDGYHFACSAQQKPCITWIFFVDSH